MGIATHLVSNGTSHLISNTAYGTCSTAAGTAAKAVTLADFDVFTEGMLIAVKFTYSNTAASPTLNVNSKGAKPIYLNGTTAPGTTVLDSWDANSVVLFIYNTTNNANGCWMMTGASSADDLKTELNNIKSDIGTKSSLTTDAKNNLVAAINEVDSHADTNASNMGNKANLTTEDKSNLVAAINELDTRKANTDGAYDEMTVGSAEQLIGTQYVEDTDPYLFRTSGGTADIGDREDLELTGGSIAWNQLLPIPQGASRTANGLTITNNYDGFLSVSGTATAQTDINVDNSWNWNKIYNHVALWIINGITQGTNLWNGDRGYIWSPSYNANNLPTNKIEKFNLSNWTWRSDIQLRVFNGATVNAKVSIRCFDLTQMFGTTIANYIYSLEQATQGAGVAWFKHLFPKDYYPYDAGSILSVKPEAHKTVGFNAWDEEWEVGYINASTGQKAAASTEIRSKNYCACVPNAEYYNNAVSKGIRIFWYDADKNFILRAEDAVNVAPANAHYFMLTMGSTYGTVYKDDVTINLSWSGYRNGEYEPAAIHTYPFDPDVELRGLLKLDSDNKLYYDGDSYTSDGTVKRKYGIVDLGTLNWDYQAASSSNPEARFTAAMPYIGGDETSSYWLFKMIVSSRYTIGANIGQVIADRMLGVVNNTSQVYLTDDAYNNGASLKASLNGVYLVYKLATPTTETADTFSNPQLVDDFGTEEFIDSRTVPMPVGHYTKYVANLRDKLQHLPNTASSDGDYIVHQENHSMELKDIKSAVDDISDDLTVANASQLVSNVYENDKVPYNFRTAGGSADIGNRAYEKIIGGTVAWNQLLQKHTSAGAAGGTSATGLNVAVSDGYVIISGTPQEDCYITPLPQLASFPANHVGLMLCDGYNGTFPWGRGGFGVDNNFKNYYMNKHTTAFSFVPYIRCFAGTQYNIKVRFYGFNLTQMFGSTIADYIYSLEQATAGAGVAFFRSLFPKPYYAYNAGELISVNTDKHITTGFNQWDEETELGYIDNSTGAKVASQTRIMSKNYNPVVSGATYYAKSPYGVFLYFYDKNLNFLKQTNTGIRVTNATFIVPNDACFMKIAMQNDYGTTYNHDICINLSWSGYRNGEYEPYTSHTYQLAEDLTLRGIPKLDGSNHLYYDGDEYESDGKVTRRYGIVDLGTLTWYYNGDYNYLYSSDLTTLAKQNGGSLNSAGYSNSTGASDKKMYVGWSGTVYCFDSSYSSGQASAFKTAMSGKYLVYELATPTEETAASYTNPFIVDDFGTEEYTDYPTRDVAVPVGHDTNYPSNLRDKLQHLPNLASSDGTYFITQSNKVMSLTPYSAPTGLPAPPSSDGTYTLKVTVSSGAPTYSWV